jgi:hypothetical protein
VALTCDDRDRAPRKLLLEVARHRRQQRLVVLADPASDWLAHLGGLEAPRSEIKQRIGGESGGALSVAFVAAENHHLLEARLAEGGSVAFRSLANSCSKKPAGSRRNARRSRATAIRRKPGARCAMRARLRSLGDKSRVRLVPARGAIEATSPTWLTRSPRRYAVASAYGPPPDQPRIAVEVVRIGVGHVPEHTEVPVWDVAAVEVRRRRRDAFVRVRGRTIPTRWWRRWRWWATSPTKTRVAEDRV